MFFLFGINCNIIHFLWRFFVDQIADVSFEASSNNSISGSTEFPQTPNKKRTITYAETSSPTKDSGAQVSSKKHKPKLATLTAEEVGQHSVSKPKQKPEPITKDAGTKASSTKQKVLANLIPKKEKEWCLISCGF